MRGTAGAGNDDLEAVFAGRLGKVVQPIRRTMRRHDQGLMPDAEFVKDFGRVLHGRPVRLASHDDGNGFVGRRHA